VNFRPGSIEALNAFVQRHGAGSIVEEDGQEYASPEGLGVRPGSRVVLADGSEFTVSRLEVVEGSAQLVYEVGGTWQSENGELLRTGVWQSLPELLVESIEIID